MRFPKEQHNHALTDSSPLGVNLGNARLPDMCHTNGQSIVGHDEYSAPVAQLSAGHERNVVSEASQLSAQRSRDQQQCGEARVFGRTTDRSGISIRAE